METWKTIFQSQFFDAKKLKCEHYAHNWLFALLSTFPFSFWFSPKKYRKMSKNDEKKKRVETWRTILSNKTAFFKKALWAWCSQPLFYFLQTFILFFGFFFDGNLEISKNGKKFCLKIFSFFTCEHYAQKINLEKTVCYWKKNSKNQRFLGFGIFLVSKMETFGNFWIFTFLPFWIFLWAFTLRQRKKCWCGMVLTFLGGNRKNAAGKMQQNFSKKRPKKAFSVTKKNAKKCRRKNAAVIFAPFNI